MRRPIAVALILFAVVVGLSSGRAAERPYRVQMTGAQFVRDMLAEPDGGGQNSFRRARAMGYFDGVIDATAGSRWCPPRHELPHELNYDAAEEMQHMTPAQLNGGAGPLILASLGKLYPCTAVRGKP